MTKVHYMCRVRLSCLICHTNKAVVMPIKEYHDWKRGWKMEDALASLSETDRGCLKNKVCPDCLNAHFQEDVAHA